MLMSFADPQSVTIAAITTPLPCISVEGDRSVYGSADGLIQLSADHQVSKRIRRVVRLDLAKVTTDPFKPVENVKVDMAVYTVFDLPPAGYTNADALAVWVGYRTLLAATSDTIISKLLAGEN
jgi:hypothetical protein